jgi:hypothetical protein
MPRRRKKQQNAKLQMISKPASELGTLKIIGITTAKAALGEYPLLQVLLYDDRVFWPCDAIEQP